MEGAQNSCNPVFIEVGLRLGVERYYKYFRQFGLLDKTGTDLPGEAGTIMHQKKNMGEVELATVSFGQSFQITPVQLAATVSSLINGGRRVTPHFGVAVLNPDRTEGEKLIFPVKEGIVSEETSKEIREILECHRWENCHFSDTAKKCKSLYFLFFGICTCRRSADTGTVYYS